MKKLKLLFAAFALLLGVSTAMAQKDVTSQYITNATLSDGTNGWVKTFTKNKQTNDPADAFSNSVRGNNTVGYASEAYAGYGELIQTAYSMKQTITLPAGNYRLVCYAFFRQGAAYNTNPSKSLAKLVAGTNEVEIKTLGSITAAGYADNQAQGANCFDSKMYRNVVEFTSDGTPIEIGVEGMFDEMKSWCIVGMFELFDLNDLASVSSPTDVTYAINNSGFEYRDLSGWTNAVTVGNNQYSNSGNFGNKAGVGFYETWTPSANGGKLGNAGTFTQTLENMPAGLYELSVYAQNIEQGNGNAGGTGMFVTANSDQTEIGLSGQYKVRTTLKVDGNLTIGIKFDNCSGNWAAFDRFGLQFYGDPLAAYQDLLDAAVASAQALIDGAAGSAISATAKAAWQAVVDANDNDGRTFTEESEFTEAIANIEAANANYQAMAAPYAKWLKVKAGADAMVLVPNDNASATSTLTSAISTQNTAAEAATTPAGLNGAISDLRTAIKTFVNATEPTGGNRFEITCLVENPSFDNNTVDGWTRTYSGGGNAQTQFTCNEFWNNTFNFYQDLVGLPNGSYQLSVQAYCRPGDNGNLTNDKKAYYDYTQNINNVHAELYVNSDASKVGNIYAYKDATSAKFNPGDWTADYECVVDGGTNYFVPNSMEGASKYFANENVYKTEVAALVTDGSLRIGFRDETLTASQWTIFDNFRLFYYGSDKLVYYKQYLPQLRAEVSADLSNNAYENVLVSSEDEALDAALAADPASETEEAYKTVIDNIKDAQTAFRAAAPSYDAMVAAKSYPALTEITANIGSGVFQYPTTTPTLWSTYSSAKSAVDDYEFTTSSTAAGAQALVDALDEAKAAYEGITLNAPAAGDVFNVMITTGDDYAFKNNPLTFNADNASGAYFPQGIGVKAYRAQQITFTQVEGNKYTLSMVNADGNRVYIGTNKTINNTGEYTQIRLTTDGTKALAVKVEPTATAGVYKLWNTEADALLGCQDDPAKATTGGIYTCNSHSDFTITAATKPSVPVTIDSELKYITRIFPFAPTLPSGVKAYSCAATKGDVLTLVEENTPAANVPYIIYAETDIDEDLEGWGTAGATSYTEGLLTGVYEDTEAPVGTYVLQNNDSKFGFYQVVDVQPTVPANRCYMEDNSFSEARAAYFFPGTDITGIKAVNALNALTSGKVQIFNASGAQIPALQKGMNIIRMEDGTTQKVMVE